MKIPLWWIFRGTFVLFLLLRCLSAGQVSAHPSSSTPYNCGGHCYGQLVEAASGGAKFWGATTAITARVLTVNSPQPGFITNEMWFSDDSDSNCTQFGDCWIEVGYDYSTADGSTVRSLGTHAFWADVRPNNILCGFASCGYHQHDLGLFSLSSSDIGKKFTVTVTATGFPGGWQVRATSASRYFIANSTANFMPGSNDIALGEELYGSGFSGINAVAPLAYFDANKFQSRIGGPWGYFGSVGATESDGPPWAKWTTGYTPGSSHPGGRFQVCIQISACP